MSKTIGIFVGSLRKGSYNKTIAEAIASYLPTGYEGRIIEIGDLPLYNPDLDDEGTPPAAWQRLRDEARPLDGVLFVTPEYNRSLPAVLKNALDVALARMAKACGMANPAQWSAFPRWHRRLRCKPSSAPIARIFECADPATARSIHRQRDVVCG